MINLLILIRLLVIGSKSLGPLTPDRIGPAIHSDRGKWGKWDKKVRSPSRASQAWIDWLKLDQVH